MWMFDRAIVVHPSWTVPYVAVVANQTIYTYLHVNAYVRTKWDVFSGLSVYLTTEGQGGGALGRWTDRCDIPNYFGEYITTRIGVGALNSKYVSNAAFLGWIQDFWFTSDNLADGDTFPGDASKQFVVFGDLLQPSENGEDVIID
jgi:hypothetical protein